MQINSDFSDLLRELSAAGALTTREDLIRNKRATGRPKDLADLRRLEADQ